MWLTDTADLAATQCQYNPSGSCKLSSQSCEDTAVPITGTFYKKRCSIPVQCCDENSYIIQPLNEAFVSSLSLKPQALWMYYFKILFVDIKNVANMTFKLQLNAHWTLSTAAATHLKAFTWWNTGMTFTMKKANHRNTMCLPASLAFTTIATNMTMDQSEICQVVVL